MNYKDSMIRLASTLPKGSPDRRILLSSLIQASYYEECDTCGQKLEAYERYLHCPKKPKGQQHGPFTKL